MLEEESTVRDIIDEYTNSTNIYNAIAHAMITDKKVGQNVRIALIKHVDMYSEIDNDISRIEHIIYADTSVQLGVSLIDYSKNTADTLDAYTDGGLFICRIQNGKMLELRTNGNGLY